jgi:rare lipoprotein A
MGSLFLLFSLFLTGCGLLRNGTPTVEKHAKRGYNKPYEANGNSYRPQGHYEYSEVGIASHYGQRDGFHGRKTSTGERFSANGLTAAHPRVPIPSIVLVTNLENGRSLKLKVIDRGPFVKGRIIDVSSKAAKLLGFYEKGLAKVRVETLVNESILFANNYKPNRSSVTRNKKQRQTQPSILLAHNDKNNAPFRLVNYEDQNWSHSKYSQSNRLRSSSKKTGVKGVFVQMGVYSNSEKAQRLARLTKQKFRVPAKTYGYNKNKKKYYRVLAGPFKSKENASDLLQRIKAQGYRNAVVVYK